MDYVHKIMALCLYKNINIGLTWFYRGCVDLDAMI